jgi:2-keto-3-deoxy-L-arabinonate dehydratase
MTPSARPNTGVFPIAPTPFTVTGNPDFEGQRRVLDCIIDQGSMSAAEYDRFPIDEGCL